MSFTLFNNKKHKYTRNIKRNDIRKPNVDTNKFGEVIKKPIHLGVKKKKLIFENKKEL